MIYQQSDHQNKRTDTDDRAKQQPMFDSYKPREHQPHEPRIGSRVAVWKVITIGSRVEDVMVKAMKP
jgi:hypothetical protein